MITTWMNVIIVVLAAFIVSSAIIIPIILVGKDMTFPAYKVLMNIFIIIESVGGIILAFGIILFRKMRSQKTYIRVGWGICL